MEGIAFSSSSTGGHTQFRLILAMAAACLILPLPANASPVNYCDKKANYTVKVKGVDISPNPVLRGEQATFNISATTADIISKGKLVIDVKYFGMHIHQETRDLCKETTCPASPGNFVLSHQEILPSYAPPGSYTLLMRMVGEDGHQLACIVFSFSIGFISPVAAS